MCPACITAALLAAGTLSASGFVVIRKVRKPGGKS
jgi:hypothetical protein